MWIKGYAILPCFKVRALKESDNYSYGADFICHPVLQWIFAMFFAWAWDGTITIVSD